MLLPYKLAFVCHCFFLALYSCNGQVTFASLDEIATTNSPVDATGTLPASVPELNTPASISTTSTTTYGQIFPFFIAKRVWQLTTDEMIHGLRTLNEAFFHQNPKVLGLGRKFGQINFGAFGVFSDDLSAPILVL